MLTLLAAALLAAPGGGPEGATVSGKISAVAGARVKRKMRVVRKYVGPGIEHHEEPDPSPAVVYLEGVPAGPPAKPTTVDVRQKGLEFRPRVLVIRKGTTVRFPNKDPIFHQVFSYSQTKRFELGRYAPGEAKTVTFDKTGLVDGNCEIHKFMRLYIHVLDHPYYALAQEDGRYSIPNVPPGTYTLVVWKEFFGARKQPIEVKADGAKIDVELSRAPEPKAEGTAAAR